MLSPDKMLVQGNGAVCTERTALGMRISSLGDPQDGWLKEIGILDLPRFQLDDALPNGEDRRLGSVVDMKFVKNIANMIFDSFLAEVQDIGNFFIGFPIRHQSQDRDFPIAQVMFQDTAFLTFSFRKE